MKKLRICFKFIANMFLESAFTFSEVAALDRAASSLCSRLIATFGLSEVLFGIFALSIPPELL